VSIERSRNLMGVAAGHEAGERRASPIAPGAKPLTAEQRKAAREARERQDAVAVCLDLARVAMSPNYDSLGEATRKYLLANMSRRLFEQQCDPAESVDWEKFANHPVHIGVDRARPGRDRTVIWTGEHVVDPHAFIEKIKENIWNRY
jgi:hypothetical protein